MSTSKPSSKREEALRLLSETSKIEQRIEEELYPIPSLDDILNGCCRARGETDVEMRVEPNGIDWSSRLRFERQWELIPMMGLTVQMRYLENQGPNYFDNENTFPDLYT